MILQMMNQSRCECGALKPAAHRRCKRCRQAASRTRHAEENRRKDRARKARSQRLPRIHTPKVFIETPEGTKKIVEWFPTLCPADLLERPYLARVTGKASDPQSYVSRIPRMDYRGRELQGEWLEYLRLTVQKTQGPYKSNADFFVEHGIKINDRGKYVDQWKVG